MTPVDREDRPVMAAEVPSVSGQQEERAVTMRELHADMIGQEVTWEVTPGGEKVEGVCRGVKDPGTTIVNRTTGERWRAVQFLIDTGSGRRWSCAFADHKRPISDG